jgi:modulator of FtsH protease
MTSVDLEGWHDFAAATVGAAGALAGLIIVAVSVNVKQIIAGSALPARAGATIASIAVILVSSMAMLIPSQRAEVLGIELVAFAAAALAFQVDAAVRMLRSHDGPRLALKIPTIVLGAGQLSGVLAGGILLIAGNPDGLFHVAAGFIVIFIVSIVNAWVLMVEILR